MGLWDLVSDVNLIDEYAIYRGSFIKELAVESLKSAGLDALKESHLVKISNSRHIGQFDLQNTILEIATCDGDRSKFDMRLRNHAYEMLKITVMLSVRLRIIIALFNLPVDEQITKLEDISSDTANLKIRVYQSI